MEQQEFSGTLAPNLCDPVSSFSCLVSSGRQDKQTTYLADIPPDTARCNNNSEIWDRNDSILSRYWSPEDGIARSVFYDGTNNGNYLDSQSHHLTYGEVTPLGVRQLAYEMGIANCDDRDYQTRRVNDDHNNDGSEIVFYDLGSGVGRLVTQMYIDQPDRVAKAIGIELAEDRHSIGAIALERIIAEEQYEAEFFFHTAYEDDKDIIDASSMIATMPFPIQLVHGDALEVDFDPATTHVFISSLCFPQNILLALQKKLLRLSNIRVVAALNRLDLIHQLGGEQWEERNVPIQMSWGDSMAKIYRKSA
jgi:hypothetical protein